MRWITKWLSLSLVVSAFTLPSKAATLFKDSQFKVKVTRSIQFGTGEVRDPSPGKRPLLLDVYQPDGADLSFKRPAVIAIHGGGFVFGDKSEMTNLCREFAARGYACFSINYRLVPDDPPGSAQDQYTRTVFAAVADADRAAQWIEQNAAPYHIDTARMFIAGSSAGAVTSMLLAYNPEIKTPHFRAVADLWGTMGPRVNWIKRGGPPLVIIHGTEDDTITVSAAKQIDARAKEVGLTHETYIIEGMGHSLPLNLEVNGATLLQHVMDFFYRQIAPSRPKSVAQLGQ